MEPLHVKIQSEERSYPIVFEEKFSALPKLINGKMKLSKILIVTDSNVDELYGDEVQNLLTTSGFEVHKFVFEAGEKQKHLDTISDIYNACLENRLDRGSAILALGGGVTGDIAGFAAASYMRGIHFIQVPTTLLAQSDSSVGGKVGVDYKGTKNIVGAFHQPMLVYMNLSTLNTLPKREYTAGLAEVVKHGIIYDQSFFEYIEQNIDHILNLDIGILKYLVRKNCYIKSQVVEQDEKEQGLRAILNFGHTIGHGIESVFDFSLLHGECVAIGMNAATYIALEKKMINDIEYERVISLIKRTGLPVQVKNIDSDRVYEEMLKDKKKVKNDIKFILPTTIGNVIQTTEVNKNEIYDALQHIAI